MQNQNMCVPAVSLDKVTTVIRMQDVKFGDLLQMASGNVFEVKKVHVNYRVHTGNLYTVQMNCVLNDTACTETYNSKGASVDNRLCVVQHTSVVAH